MCTHTQSIGWSSDGFYAGFTSPLSNIRHRIILVIEYSKSFHSWAVNFHSLSAQEVRPAHACEITQLWRVMYTWLYIPSVRASWFNSSFEGAHFKKGWSTSYCSQSGPPKWSIKMLFPGGLDTHPTLSRAIQFRTLYKCQAHERVSSFGSEFA